MIYFLQDTDRYAIKIGYTASDIPEMRRKACQTGNAFPLVVLATMAGEEKDERALHARFAKHKLMGEWFQPTAELLEVIFQAKAIAVAPKLLPPHENFAFDTKKWPLTIYLAGKISKNDWRSTIVDDLKGTDDFAGEEDDCPYVRQEEPHNPFSWEHREKAIGGVHSYAGPFFMGNNHRNNAHGDDSHGVAANSPDKVKSVCLACCDDEEPGVCRYCGENEDDCVCSYGSEDKDKYGHESHEIGCNHCDYTAIAYYPRRREEVCLGACQHAIRHSDIVFAWINQSDCYGTIAEIGYADALGKEIWIAGPRRYRDMWFVYQHASHNSYLCSPYLELNIDSPNEILQRWLQQREKFLSMLNTEKRRHDAAAQRADTAS